MACAERSALWAFAAGELPAAEHERVGQHLVSCLECQREHEAIQGTRSVLAVAAGLEPQVDWRAANEKVTGGAARRLAKLETGWWPLGQRLAFGMAGAAALAVAVLAVVAERPEPRVPPVAPMVSAETSVIEAVELASVVLPGTTMPLEQGARVEAGTLVQTQPGGRVVLQLPDGSRLRMAPESTLKLNRASRRDVGLALASGRIDVRAAHVERDGFTVEASGVRVRVVGTAFSVAVVAQGVEVSVVEGAVAVELASGRSERVAARERVLVEASGQVARRATEEDEARAFVELGLAAPVSAQRPVASAPKTEVREPPGQPVRQPARVSQQGAVLAPPPSPPVPVGPPEPLARTPAAIPEAPPPEQKLEPVPVEEFRLRQAERAIGSGDCGRFLGMLAEYLEEAQSPAGRERARITRARCFDDLVMPMEADAEYRRYLREFPNGRFAPEARSVVAH